jgi:hypothetical protein
MAVKQEIVKKTAQASSAKLKGKKGPVKSLTKKAQMKKLEKELDRLWSLVIRKVWGEKCGWPGCNHPESRVAAHHYWHRAQGNRSRWDIRNGIALDFYHHIQVVHRQGNVEPIRDAIINRIGIDQFNDLKISITSAWKPTFEDLLELKSQFESELSNQLDRG